MERTTSPGQYPLPLRGAASRRPASDVAEAAPRLDSAVVSASPLTVARFRLRLEEEQPGLLPAQHMPIRGPQAAVPLLWSLVFEGEPREVLAALFLDPRNRPIGYQVAATGTLNRVTFEPRHLLVSALLCNAAGLLVAHNHPSGHLGPSNEDLLATRRLEAAADVLGVRLLDHLIVASDRGELRWHSLLRRADW